MLQISIINLEGELIKISNFFRKNKFYFQLKYLLPISLIELIAFFGSWAFNIPLPDTIIFAPDSQQLSMF